MAESDIFMHLLLNAEENPQVNQIIEEVNRFKTYIESMGLSTKKKEILRSREEMKFDTVNSNLYKYTVREKNSTCSRIRLKKGSENEEEKETSNFNLL